MAVKQVRRDHWVSIEGSAHSQPGFQMACTVIPSSARADHGLESCGAGLIPDILDVFPEASVVGSKVALMYLKGLTHRPFEQKPVKGGDKIELGAGHTLEFVMAPNLHWCVPVPPINATIHLAVTALRRDMWGQQQLSSLRILRGLMNPMLTLEEHAMGE